MVLHIERACKMSNIKKIAAAVSALAIVLLIYTISTFKNNDIPTSGSPVSCMSETSVTYTNNSVPTGTTTKPAASNEKISGIVSCVTTVPNEVSSGENSGHVIVPFSKEPEKAPPARINPAPVKTPDNIVFKSIPLICHDTQPPEQNEEDPSEPEDLPVTEMIVTDAPLPETETSSSSAVITSVEVQPSDANTPNIKNE